MTGFLFELEGWGWALFVVAEAFGVALFGWAAGLGKLRLAEWHHGYLGDALFFLGCFLGSEELALLGLLLRLDDSHQHYRQIREPGYRSILARLYGATLWRIPAVQRLNRWLDHLFAEIGAWLARRFGSSRSSP